MSDRPVFHPWIKSAKSHETYTRALTTPEFILAMLNEHAQGHNCPYLGATISVKNAQLAPLDAKSLKQRLEQAFVATRWRHPVIACQVKNSREVVYKVEDQRGVEQWVKRTVRSASTTGGWLSKHEDLSRETPLPTQDGDCAQLYLILGPEQRGEVTKFDLLLRAHHALVDGTGLRSILNDILSNLATPCQKSAFAWGEEELRLPPAAVDAAIISEEITKQISQIPKEVPLPPLPAPVKARFGTGVVAYTFDSPSFVNKLRDEARAHGVRLTSTIQAALVSTIHESVAPREDHTATVISGFDLRAANLEAPWHERNRYVGAAVGLEMMQVQGSTLRTHEMCGDLWPVAKEIQRHWDAVAERKDVAAAGELRREATGFILKMVLDEVNKPPSGLGLTLNYVSDPPGENQLEGRYDNAQGPSFGLEGYQTVTDESTPRLSCRSHSWQGKVTLEISFSYKHHTQRTAQCVMDKWARYLGRLVLPDDE